MSNLARKIARQGKKQQAAQMIGLLNALAPGLHEVEGQLKKVADAGPSIQQAYAEWENVLGEVRSDVQALRDRIEQTRTVLLVLIHEMAQNTSVPMEAFLERAKQLDEQYADAVKTGK